MIEKIKENKTIKKITGFYNDHKKEILITGGIVVGSLIGYSIRGLKKTEKLG